MAEYAGESGYSIFKARLPKSKHIMGLQWSAPKEADARTSFTNSLLRLSTSVPAVAAHGTRLRQDRHDDNDDFDL
jgi:hypothetical protein